MQIAGGFFIGRIYIAAVDTNDGNKVDRKAANSG